MNPTVRKFAPEYWDQLERFTQFYSQTFDFSPGTKKAVSGALNHFRKVLILKSLALKIKPNLELDNQELEKNCFTPANNSRELSAVIEGIILELHSSIDCTRKVLYAIFKNYKGIQNSTRKLFQNAFHDKIDDRFPEYLKETIKGAHWYSGLMKIRDELTHSDVGSCHLDRKTDKVSYIHTGFTINGKALVIEDIFEKVDDTFKDVNEFLSKIYGFLNSQLSDNEVWQMCGIFGGRIYSRFVKPSEAIDFNSGRCEAFQWFEKEENPTCPFVETCGAYKNRKC